MTPASRGLSTTRTAPREGVNRLRDADERLLRAVSSLLPLVISARGDDRSLACECVSKRWLLVHAFRTRVERAHADGRVVCPWGGDKSPLRALEAPVRCVLGTDGDDRDDAHRCVIERRVRRIGADDVNLKVGEELGFRSRDHESSAHANSL